MKPLYLAYNIAVTCAKALQKRKTLYATGACREARTLDTNRDRAWVDVTINGYLYRVTVENIDPLNTSERAALSEQVHRAL